MRLERLEINGFKSFPDRAEFRFDHGVTAIVGPNGCGKSNVVDAIAWVLGEQSARSLRGDRMEDVIFSGSDARKPTAAAEVRLSLGGVSVPVRPPGGRRSEPAPDTADLDGLPRLARDVQVSRRLFRSGESEYLIDGEVCRLRDIQDLLFDAGVGTRSYALIEQGKIGQILSARPADRRMLIEEAAGVTKYKTRRRAAELKLEAASQNLARIEDILVEVERQRGSLRRQAARARRYRRLREELRRWEKALFARRYRQLAKAIETARGRLAEAQTREAATAGQLTVAESELDRRRLTLAEIEARATAARQSAHQRELAIGQRQQQLAFDRDQIAALGRALIDASAELEALDARRGPARHELETTRRAAEQTALDAERAAHELADAEAAHALARSAIEGLEGDVEAARSGVFSAINAATALRHAVEHAGSTHERLSDTIAKLEVERAEVEAERERSRLDLDRAAADLARAGAASNAAADALLARETQAAALQAARDERARTLRAAEHELAAHEARLASLEELDSTRAGYGDAARLVLGTRGFPHQGAVADHVEVDPRYERAVEGGLGELLQFIVVPTRRAAEAGLRLVREQGGGRCGFLIADGLDRPAAAGPAHAEGLEPLRAAVRVHGRAARAIEAAIGTALLAESFEAAAAAARSADCPVVTPEGDVFLAPGLVRGGGRPESHGILSIKRGIKELRERIGQARREVETLERELADLDTAARDASIDTSTLLAERHRLEKTIVALDERVRHVRDEVDRHGRRLELVALEWRTALEERTALEARRDEANRSIVRLETDQRQADDRLALAQRRLFEARETNDSLARRATEARAVHARLVERAAAAAVEAGRLDVALAELEARIAARAAERQRARQRRDDLEVAVTDGQRLLDVDLVAFDALRAAVRLAEDELAALHGDLRADEDKVRAARRLLDEARADVSQLDMARATAEGDLTHLAASCVDAVGSTLDDVVTAVEVSGGEADLIARLTGEADAEAEGEEGPVEDGGEVQAADDRPTRVSTPEDAIALLRAKIDRLGPVNMMAVEQFDELDARHRFLSAQRQDLVDSIAATGEAIERIDRTTRARFREAYDRINEHFQATFRTLFGGGRAGLVLIDESDLLESGVDIIAEPPGKRLQNVQLLSGGEKALTAMALMFAIFKYRPSPFCLLDEIDAPLDDANIGRFVEMLRGLQTATQFILITHNRRTMEIADRLYGVTMEEPGVSKLISVQLN